MSLKYQSKSYINKIARQKKVYNFAKKANVSLKDARIYFREGLTVSEAKKIDKLIKTGKGTKFNDLDTIASVFFGDKKGRKGLHATKIDKQANKEIMAHFLATNKKAKTKKDAYHAFESQAAWNPGWSTIEASKNNIKTMLQKAGAYRQFSGVMLKHRGMNEQWNPNHLEYNGYGSDSKGQFTQYTYTSFKNGQPYRKAIIKIYNSRDDIDIEYNDL